MTAARYFSAAASLLLAAAVLQVSLGSTVALRSDLEGVPRRLGAWAGADDPPHPDALSRARPDAYLSRRYVDGEGRPVHLYVAFFARESARGQAQAACWGDCQVRELRPGRLTAAGQEVEVNVAVVVQEGEPAVVLYWYQVGRRPQADPYRTKLELARRALLERRTDGALVRVSAPVRSDVQEALARAERFARLAFPELVRWLPE